jgi:hypothetical protein
MLLDTLLNDNPIHPLARKGIDSITSQPISLTATDLLDYFSRVGGEHRLIEPEGELRS